MRRHRRPSAHPGDAATGHGLVAGSFRKPGASDAPAGEACRIAAEKVGLQSFGYAQQEVGIEAFLLEELVDVAPVAV